jgi:ElaB/YqjD/DUF883 family membrane-anchored ribosome-binding protein
MQIGRRRHDGDYFPSSPSKEFPMTASNTFTNSSTVSGMAGRAKDAIDQVADKATPAVERGRETAHRTIDKIADTATPAAEWAAESSRRLVTRSSELVDAAGSYVREKPLATIAGALAVGYLVGRMMR